MEGRVHTVLVEVERTAFWGAVVLLFLSLQLSSLLYVLLLWCTGAGLLVAYTMFRVIPRVPNLLVHKPRPPHLSSTHQVPPTKPVEQHHCSVCNEPQCKRHADEEKKEFLHPWDNLFVPASVDSALEGFFGKVLKSFVWSWKTKISESVGFEDELRVYIRFAMASLLRRAQKVDIPHLISHKLLPAIAAHVYICNRARRRLPNDASIAQIEAAVIKEYGSHLHCAMRGSTGNTRYFRQLTKTLMPLLLPERVLQSRMVSSLFQELFAVQVFVRTMDYAAKPDFLNKLLLIVFDKNSRLEPMCGEGSLNVLLLAHFAERRSNLREMRPLSISLKQLLEGHEYLYEFMKFMKKKNALPVLQVYLALDDLKTRLNKCTEGNAQEVLSQVEKLRKDHLLPSSPHYLPLENGAVHDLTAVLNDSESTPLDKCSSLRAKGIFGSIRGYIYNELLVKIFYPQFCQDYMFYDMHISKPDPAASKGATSRTGDKWRQKTSQVSMKVRLKRAPSTEDVDTGRESPSVQEATPTSCLSAPIRIQVVDAQTINPNEAKMKKLQQETVGNKIDFTLTDGLRPYTLYYILATRKDEETGTTKNYFVKRRFKEFLGLDAKLRHFHGSITATLPSKRTFRNLEKAFVETRRKELEQYLQELIQIPIVRDGQVLASFLDATSDPSLFMPDTVGDRAGKAMTKFFKKEKEPFVEEYLQSVLQAIETPQTPQTSGEASAASTTNRDLSKRYVHQQCEDMSDSEAFSLKPWLHPPELELPVEIHSLMDLVVFVAVNVYQVTPFQLTSLMLAKLLGQESIESLVYNFVAGKVGIMTSEENIVKLINLLTENLFENKDPPRTEIDISQRFDDTLECLFKYPHPLIRLAIGEDRYKDGTARIIEGLQCRELNKQLFFQLLDIFILELFPELQERN